MKRNARKDAKNLDLYNPDTRYDFLMNNPNNSNVLLLYRAMARLGFRWDDYKGGGLVKRIKTFENVIQLFFYPWSIAMPILITFI